MPSLLLLASPFPLGATMPSLLLLAPPLPLLLHKSFEARMVSNEQTRHSYPALLHSDSSPFSSARLSRVDPPSSRLKMS